MQDKEFIDMDSKNDRYAFLYDFAKSSFDNELARFKSMEDKASKLISLLTVAIAAYTAIVGSALKVLLPVDDLFVGFVFFLVVLTFLALFSTWYALYRSLEFRPMPRIAFDSDFIAQYPSESLPTHHYTLAKACADSLLHARSGVEEKRKDLQRAHSDMGLAALLFVVSFSSIGGLYLFHPKGKAMSEQNNQSNQPKQEEPVKKPVQTQPNVNAPAKKLTLVMEAYTGKEYNFEFEEWKKK